MSRPLVSVVTGTWQRHDLLMEAIANLREQTYRPLEHIVVSDGPDPELREMIGRNLNLHAHDCIKTPERYVPIVFQECGFNWSSFLAASMSAVPFQVAQWLTRGPLLCWMADDERFQPDHIESLVTLLEEKDADFVYSRCAVWMLWHGPQHVMEIGTDPPVLGTVTNVLYRRELLDYRGFRQHIGSGSDWDQVQGWMQAGARWAMLDRVTMSHRADKQGEGPEYRPLRQPLRGQISGDQRRL